MNMSGPRRPNRGPDSANSVVDPESQSDTKLDLDTILVNEIGPFGRYQIRTLALAVIPVIFAAFHAGYVFTTARINTRCLIPECEESPEFAPSWIHNAIPSTAGTLDKCHRYGSTNASFTGTNDTCPAALFNTSILEDCEQRVYENQLTVVYDFDLGCDEWRRTIIGTMHKAGSFPALLFTGYISDSWGRRTALVINSFISAWIGLTRYWITSYTGYVLSEFLESFFSAGIFSSVYLLVLELVGPEYRVYATGALSCLFMVGEVLLGTLAWIFHDWRSLTLALYAPQLISIGYFWVFAESVRWNMSKGRYAESDIQLKNVARINKKELSEKSLELLRLSAEEEKRMKGEEKLQKLAEPWLPSLVYRHKKVLLRCLVIPMWWITGTMTYYGLAINSVDISGNKYVNYITVVSAGIPGIILAIYISNNIGRKRAMIAGFWGCAACQLAYVLLPTGKYELSLAIYLVGSCAIAMVMSTNYVYTSELFPTQYRHKLLAYCSMIGRFGSVTAPLTPAFAATTFPKMPFIMFGTCALVSGGLVFLMPETLGTKLPDTMEEANEIGLKKQK